MIFTKDFHGINSKFSLFIHNEVLLLLMNISMVQVLTFLAEKQQV